MSKYQASKSGSLIIFTIIFLTGFTFLVYEVSWNRMLSLVLGATVSASTIVLATFMAGFSLGAYFFGRAINQSHKPKKLLAGLLTGIGFAGLINYYILKTFLPFLYPVFRDREFSILATELIVYGISIILLLFQTFLVGGMLPIVGKIIIRRKESISSGIGRIYALDTLGSAIGGLLAGFVLLGNLGQQNTVLLAVGINLLIGIYLYLSKPNRYTEITKDSAEAIETLNKSKTKFKEVNETLLNRKIALPTTFFFGFSIMALQVIWMRMYKIYLTNTSYTFALISSLVIIGFFFGSWLFSKYSSRIKNHGITMLHSILLLSFLTVTGLIILINLPEFIMFPFESLLSSPFIKLIIMPMLAALVVVFPPAVISGFAFPLACRMLTNNVDDVSKGVGTALTLNALGSAIGPLLAGFVLIPLLGSGVSVILILCIEFFLSVSMFSIKIV
ncbi:MAG: fused MFS/spermidine synthase [Bacteroidales bacterium]